MIETTAPPVPSKRGPKPRPRIEICPQRCKTCKEVKHPTEFERDGPNGEWLRTECRACRSKRRRERMRERYHNDPAYRAKVQASNRDYANENRSYLNDYARTYYAEHREQLLEDARQYRNGVRKRPKKPITNG